MPQVSCAADIENLTGLGIPDFIDPAHDLIPRGMLFAFLSGWRRPRLRLSGICYGGLEVQPVGLFQLCVRHLIKRPQPKIPPMALPEPFEFTSEILQPFGPLRARAVGFGELVAKRVAARGLIPTK